MKNTNLKPFRTTHPPLFALSSLIFALSSPLLALSSPLSALSSPLSALRFLPSAKKPFRARADG